MKVNHDEFVPTLFFGFQLSGKKEVLCQMWVNALNESQWRPVPMIETSERPQAIAGYLEDDDEDDRA